MPHKHKRKAEADADEVFDLPPTQRAAPLPTGKGRAANPRPKKRSKTSSNNNNDYGADDTPKAFARLMAFKTRGRGPKGLDDGEPRGKKKAQKKNNRAEEKHSNNNRATADSESQAVPQPAIPKILPGEKLSDFAQRVNAALPLTGIQKNRKKIEGLPDHRITRHEKKLKKLQEGWRKEEARLREKEAEERELAEEEQDEIEAMWEDKTADLPAGGKKKKRGKKGKKLVAGEVDIKEEDPWEALKRNREQRKGLHDVVQAPPTFDRVPREIFKVRDGARVEVGNIPNSVGSLRKREELAAERLTLIDTYRKLMAERKGQ
ncbi:uncharacterized protein EI97DRAFT_436389 [Westerdykella ornata]|uniref:Uncharacterized protein n=1 Tax=Westerdykella ornata TaxID=318751 RepID=A0A6A6JA66_WESOR|nr:uncharacterized protein EI97DRAFT_436389 [Westerdykella ornata]KAF2273147.1 hypothetical protein EI97DRAFT_436389 [Westerdykella ornata]